MVYYKIEIKKSAQKDLRRFPEIEIKKITRSILRLKDNPFPVNCRKIQLSESLYRIRVGDYRVIYEVLIKEKTIMIHYIRHRKDVYRNL